MRDCIYGLERKVPLLDGTYIRYVNLDNAASTPPLKEVVDAVAELSRFYSSVHRGTGYKSRLCTEAYDKAHKIIGKFVGANLETNTVIFGRNATDAINKLAHRLSSPEGSVVISTRMEHHSNDLPWRYNFDTVFVRTTADGRFDEEHYESLIEEYWGRIRLVTVTGASNVTGYIQPIHKYARMAHEAGALFMVDAAQLAPHRKIDMKADEDPEHLDFVAIAGHKMYAPYGTGALIGPKRIFLEGAPEYPGGGTVSIVTPDEVFWADTPDRDEAGSPNVIGAVAMAVAAKTLMEKGMDTIAEHERQLTQYALEKFASLSYVRVFGETNPAKADEKVGVIPFNMINVDHSLVASISGYEGGVGVRNGCFCAHPYVVSLLHLLDDEVAKWRTRFMNNDKSKMPGLVRMSFGCYSNKEDIDRLFNILARIEEHDYIGEYVQIKNTGEYIPKNYTDDFFKDFSI